MQQENSIRAVIFDLDGVVWRGNTPLPGAQDIFTYLRENNIPFALATNNATASREEFKQRMEDIGVPVSVEEITTSAVATAEYLKGEYPPGTKVIMLGENGLMQAMLDAGLTLVEDPEEAEIAVSAMDRELTWKKLNKMVNAIRRGIPYIATNGDGSFPLENGYGVGSGGIMAALEKASDVKALTIGKPEPRMYEIVMKRLQAKPQSILVLGDRLETDILGAIRAGMKTGLLLTGVTSREMLETSSIQPDLIFEDLFEVIEFLTGGRH
ncbi:MAG: HAD-IIA family hydrolase [Anaerolineales bacterium]|nr:HAD-IIA family hydrolase [Anaerolineales bacterium]